MVVAVTFPLVRQQNWAGTYEYQASGILQPSSIAELQDLVRRQLKIRALGTRHSFNDVADGPGFLVTAAGIPPDVVIAEDCGSVTVGSGARYAVAAVALEEVGLALHNMGSLPHISVGGATATGTHGSGARNGSLSTAVRAVEFVGADGELRSICRGDVDFEGSVIHLGALGVATRITLDVEPTYRVRQDVYVGVPWSALDGGGLQDLMNLGHSTSLFTSFGDDITQMWVKTRIPDGQADVDVPEEIAGAHRHSGRLDFVGVDDNTTPLDGSVGAWLTRLPHFRVDRAPSNGDEIQAEYFVALDDGTDALAAVRALADKIRPHLLVSELRAVRGDGAWLSETQGRDSFAIHFTFVNHPAAIAALLPAIEAALAPFVPRPHWGKVFTLTPQQIQERYPRLDDFRALVEEQDPAGKFRGRFLDRYVFGR